MIVDSVLTSANAYLDCGIVNCSIAIENGEIFKIGNETQMPKADEKINLRNLLVLPGLIDVHVHLRDEGKAYKETFQTGTAAAAAGGITTVLDMPNNDPVTMNTERLRNRMRLAKNSIFVNVGFYSEFPNNRNEIRDLIIEGAKGFKLFMASQIGGLNIDNDMDLREAFEKAGELGVIVAVHAEDKNLLAMNQEKMKQAHLQDPNAFLKAHSEQVELKAILRLLKICEKLKVHLHFCHLTSQKGLNAVIDAKKSGKQVTCEVTPNHLLLSKADLNRYGSLLIMMPPVRTQNQVDALWTGIKDGWVDVLGSDHAPHTLIEKTASNVWDVKVGVPGLETTLPLMLTMVKRNRLPLSCLVQLLSEKPAAIFNIKSRGSINNGKKADLTVVDLKEKFRIDSSKFHSKARYSPFDGWEVQGRPKKTFVNGLLVMDEQEIIVKPGSAEILRSSP